MSYIYRNSYRGSSSRSHKSNFLTNNKTWEERIEIAKSLATSYVVPMMNLPVQVPAHITADEFVSLCAQRQDFAEMAIVTIFANQNLDEAVSGSANTRNRKGFRTGDAKMGSRLACWVLEGKHWSNGYETEGHKRALPYHRQVKEAFKAGQFDKFLAQFQGKEYMESEPYWNNSCSTIPAPTFSIEMNLSDAQEPGEVHGKVIDVKRSVRERIAESIARLQLRNTQAKNLFHTLTATIEGKQVSDEVEELCLNF